MSTTIYELIVDSDNFSALEVVDEADLDRFIDGFEAEPMAATWSAPRVRVAPNTPRGDVPLPDFASLFGAVPIVSQRVVEAFDGELESQGELLGLRCDDGNYWAFNVVSTVDLLDEAQSTGDWFDRGRLMTLTRLIARRPVPDDVPPIFKLPQWRKGRALVTQAFIDTVRKHRLSGLDPRPVGET